jgi:TetR/AcrR family transcriptional regulator, transcriptional repressor for nem operon
LKASDLFQKKTMRSATTKIPEKASEIMNAAERRIRTSGYNGFSFREIATDVGVKSSSVHHHFPTKPALAVAVARRYVDRFEAALANAKSAEDWRAVFRKALIEDGQMCLCGVLGAESGDLPAEVSAEARRFFRRNLKALGRLYGPPSAASRQSALRVMAILEGAMMLARTLDDPSVFEDATRNLP